MSVQYCKNVFKLFSHEKSNRQIHLKSMASRALVDGVKGTSGTRRRSRLEFRNCIWSLNSFSPTMAPTMWWFSRLSLFWYRMFWHRLTWWIRFQLKRRYMIGLLSPNVDYNLYAMVIVRFVSNLGRRNRPWKCRRNRMIQDLPPRRFWIVQ